MDNESDTVNVFIVAGSVIARAGLESVLRAKDEFVVTGGAAEISAAPSAFSVGQTAAVVLVNIEREKDFDDLQELLNDDSDEIDLPSVVILVPIEMQSSDYAIRALQNGVRGILPHEATANEIIAAVTAAANDLITLSPDAIDNLLSFSMSNDVTNSPIGNGREYFSDGMVENLTAREMEILEMLTGGASNKAIAYQLNISEHTVKFHVASIFGKFGVNTRTEAVTQALRRGLILL